MDDNPWQVDTIEDFSYYKCPECSFEVRKQQVFQEHAIENHPLSYVFFGKKDEEEEFHDPLKIEDVTSNALVVQYEKLPNKKEIRFKNNLQETQRPENIDANVSFCDKSKSDSETKIDKSNQENSPYQLQKEEEFNDPLKIEDFASNAMVIRCEKLPNKKEIRFKIDLQATQSTENCEDNVSLSDELISESETKVEFCNEDKVKKFEMEKEFAIDSHQQARIKFCRDSNVTPDVKDIDVLPEIMDNS